MKKSLSLTLLGLAVLSAACQPQLTPANPSTSSSASQASSARIMTITSETSDPKLPKILVPGLALKVFAGSGKAGYKDGPKLEAEFKSIGDMTQDDQGNFYISDYEDFRIRKIDTEGNVFTLAGTGKQVANGKTGDFLQTEFDNPGLIIFKSPHSLLVQNSSVRLFLLNLNTQKSQLFIKETEINPNPPYQGNFQETSRELPLALGGSVSAITLYNNAIYLGRESEIWKLTETQGLYRFERHAGNAAVDPTGGSIDDPARNFKDGPADDSKFNYVTSMVFDKVGNMYVSDAGNHRIRKVESGTRHVSTLTGYVIPAPLTTSNRDFKGGFEDGSLEKARFNGPSTLILDNENLFIYDSGNQALRIITQNQVHTLIQNCKCGGLVKEGRSLYVADQKNLQIYTIDLSQLEKLKPQILKMETQS